LTFKACLVFAKVQDSSKDSQTLPAIWLIPLADENDWKVFMYCFSFLNRHSKAAYANT
jgi:hypothetical protein